MKQYSLFELQKAALKYPPKYGHYICPPPRHGKSWAAEKIKIMNPEIEIGDKVDKTPTELKGQLEAIPITCPDEASEIFDDIYEDMRELVEYQMYIKNRARNLKRIQDYTGKITYSDLMITILELCPQGIKINICMEPSLPGNTVRCKDIDGTRFIVSSDIYERLQKDIPKLNKDDELINLSEGD